MDSRRLVEACERGDVGAVCHSVGQRCDVNAVDNYGNTCLMIACRRGHCEMVNYLIQAGADVNRRNDRKIDGNTALYVSIKCWQLECVELLAANGLRVDFTAYEMKQLLTFIDKKLEPYMRLLIGLPWHSRAQKIAMLEMLGATCVDQVNPYNYQITKGKLLRASEYWSKALEERQLAEPCDQVQAKVEQAPPAYGHSREFLAEDDLISIETSPEDMIIQSLIIRERILGLDTPTSHPFASTRAEWYFRTGRYDKCIALWLHLLELQVHSLYFPWINPMKSLVDAFQSMTSRGAAVRGEDVLTAFSFAIQPVMERCTNDMCYSEFEHFRLHFKYIIQCMCIVIQLNLSGDPGFLQILRDLVEFISRQDKFHSLLHVVCKLQYFNISVYDVVRLLLEGGDNPRLKNRSGDTPLHVIARHNHPNKCDVIKLMLAKCCSCAFHTRNANGRLFTDYLSGEMVGDVKKLSVFSQLQCLAAVALVKYNIPYEPVLPTCLSKFVKLHY